MSFMDKVKQGIGIGTPTMHVEVKNTPTKRGEDLVALVRITGGKNPLKMNYVVADVRWIGKFEWPLADGRKVAIDGHAIFYRFNLPGSEGITLEPGKSYDFTVMTRIPAEAPLTGEHLKFDFGVRADIEEVTDPTFNTQFDITA